MEEEVVKEAPLVEYESSKTTIDEGLGSSNLTLDSQLIGNEIVSIDEDSPEDPSEEPNLKEPTDSTFIVGPIMGPDLTGFFKTDVIVSVDEDNPEDASEEPNLKEPPESTIVGPDLTEFFKTDVVFDSRDSVVQWCQDMGRKHNTVIVRGKGRNNVGGTGSYVDFRCERSGVYASHQKKDIKPKTNEELKKRKRESASKKCDCPFRVRSRCMEGNKWNVMVKCGFHNHPLPETLTGHAYVARLTKKEEELVMSMTLAGVTPRQILAALKNNFPDNKSTMRTIYNFRAKYRLEEMEGRSATQQLQKLLHKYHYAEWHEKDSNDVVINILWSHPETALLAQCFPNVLIIDSTYSADRFKMSLFHAVGVTSTGKTFTIALAFMKEETEEHYTWALSRVKALYTPTNCPSVIVMDNDLALTKSVGIVFPEASRLLCTRHIGKNVQGHCKFETTPDLCEKFNQDWHTVWRAETVDEYYDAYTIFARKWRDTHGDYVSYITDNWLNPHKEQFVLAWTNRIKHYGNSTNKAESEHGKLKQWLGLNSGTFDTCWTAMNHMIQSEISEIKADFEKSLTQTKLKHHTVQLKELSNQVSHLALDCLVDEFNRIDTEKGMLKSECGCVLRSTHGLPCAHELVRYKIEGMAIPLDVIEPHWKHLSTVPYIEERVAFDFLPELKLMRQRWIEGSELERAILVQKMKELGVPSSTCTQEPREKVKTKRGRR